MTDNDDDTTDNLHASKRPCPIPECSAPTWGFCEHTIAELETKLSAATDRIDELDAAWMSERRLVAKADEKRMELEARIAELERWKAEGIAVLDQWEQVYDMVPHPTGTLGLTKASVVQARITELEGRCTLEESGRLAMMVDERDARITELEAEQRQAVADFMLGYKAGLDDGFNQ